MGLFLFNQNTPAHTVMQLNRNTDTVRTTGCVVLEVTQTNCGAVQIKLLVHLVEVTCREVIGTQGKIETQLR